MDEEATRGCHVEVIEPRALRRQTAVACRIIGSCDVAIFIVEDVGCQADRAANRRAAEAERRRLQCMERPWLQNADT